VVVVGNGKRETAGTWSETNKFPFPVVLDPHLNLYRELGMKRSAMIWQVSNFWCFAEDHLAGRPTPTIIEGEEIHIMGGDFITNSTGELVFSYKMTDGIPKDRPALEKVLASLDN
jgi:hypothetical protein